MIIDWKSVESNFIKENPQVLTGLTNLIRQPDRDSLDRVWDVFPEERGPPPDEEHELLLCGRPDVLGCGLGPHHGGGQPLLSLQRLGGVLL